MKNKGYTFVEILIVIVIVIVIVLAAIFIPTFENARKKVREQALAKREFNENAAKIRAEVAERGRKKKEFEALREKGMLILEKGQKPFTPEELKANKELKELIEKEEEERVMEIVKAIVPPDPKEVARQKHGVTNIFTINKTSFWKFEVDGNIVVFSQGPNGMNMVQIKIKGDSYE